MTIEIHPAAASNFDTKAGELVSLIKEIPVNPPRQPNCSADLNQLKNRSFQDGFTMAFDYRTCP